MTDMQNLPLRDEEGAYHVVVEAPRASLVKLKYSPALGVFIFNRALPLGFAYPYDWGFFPSTRAEDGDPLDAMVIFECGTGSGVVIPSNPIGIVEMTQKDEKTGERVRNDRVICVPASDQRYEHVKDLPKQVHTELEHFFLAMSELSGKEVKIQGWAGPRSAKAAIEEAGKGYMMRGESK